MVAIGGYVKISGMVDESMDKEQMSKPPQHGNSEASQPGKAVIMVVVLL